MTQKDTTKLTGAETMTAVVEQIRRDLAQKRAKGSVPHLPAGELDRQFSAVVEAVDAGLVEEPALDTVGLPASAVLQTWRPAGRGVRGKLAAPFVYLFSRLVGAIIRRQLEEFTRRTAELVEQLAHRQNRVAHFLARAHLDRIRSLEYRVAELERRIEALQSGENS